MNIHALLHIPKSNYAFAYNLDTICVRFRTAKNDLDKVNIVYGDKYNWNNGWYPEDTKEMKVVLSDEHFDYYETFISCKETRFGYMFELIKGEEKYYYNESGLMKEIDNKVAHFTMYHYPYINKVDLHTIPEWTNEAVFYQIFVERFFDGNSKNNPKDITKWGEKPKSKSFFGGDIRGIISKIDYLSDLGINGIYLTPIFESPSNHKYDTIDYFEIDKAFGTKEDFKELVEKAHAKGIKIILDAVFNHCGFKFEKFQDVLNKGEKSKYCNWFHISNYPVCVENGKLNYKTFGSVAEMPKLNTSNIETKEYLLSVAEYWIKEFDIDGWRLDVSDEIDHSFWREFRKVVKNTKESAIIIGETWHNSYFWLQGDQFDSAMNYPVTKKCLEYFAENKISATEFKNSIAEILMRNTSQVNDILLNLLDSHDTERFLTMCNGNVDKLKNAATFLMTFKGIPCTYYGTEIGLEGGYDPDSRRTFDWNEDNWNKDLREFYKNIISIRKKEKALQKGAIEFIEHDDLLIMKRQFNNEIIFTIINNTLEKKELNLNIESYESIRNLLDNNEIMLEEKIAIEKQNRRIIKVTM